MNNQGPVIVAIDLEERGSRIGLAEGYAAARRDRCDLVVVHVLRPTQLAAPLFPQHDVARLFAGAERRIAAIDGMRRLVDELPRGPDTEIGLELRDGNVVDRIVELVEHARARLLVVAGATHEIGATTAAIMRRAPCPVLVARASDGAGPVIAATDLTDPSTPTIAAAAAMARTYEVELHTIHVVEPWIDPRVTLAQTGVLVPYPVGEQVAVMADHLTDHLERLGMRAVVHTPVGLPATVVTRIARESGCRLLVVGTVNRSRLWRFFTGSVAEDIVRRAPCSVLVTRLHRRARTAGAVPIGAGM